MSIIKETGWTRGYLLWKISWQNVRMMMEDAPRTKMVKKKKKAAAPAEMTFEEIQKYWQS